MKQLISIWFLLLFTAPLMHKAWIFTHYLVKYEYYQNVLCENQNLPEMNCNGKCALAEKLQNASAADKPELPQVTEYEWPFLITPVKNTGLNVWPVSPKQLIHLASKLLFEFQRVPTPPPQV